MSAVIKPVQVFSQIPAPPMFTTRVNLHYFESGSYKNVTVTPRRSTYFENIVVSSVLETTPVSGYTTAPFNSIRNIVRNSFYVTRQLALSLRGTVHLREPILDMRGLDPNNMAHLLIDVIPYFLYVRRVVGMDAQLLLRKVQSPFCELLNLFEISPIQETRQVTANFIKIRGTRGLSVYDLFGTFDCNAVGLMPDVYGAMNFPSNHNFDRVFLARRAPRNLQNQVELEAIVERYGYKTIFLEDYPIHEQLGIGAHAKHVVALHGAAMSFLLMNRKMESVLELSPPHVYHDVYPLCLGPRVGRYEMFIPEFDERVAHSGWQAISFYKNRSFSVNASVVDEILSEIH